MGSVNLSDSDICRLCGFESTNPSLIFDENDEEPFYIKINRYLPIQVRDDGLHPRRVCSSCYFSVTSTQVFLDRTIDGQRSIATLLRQGSTGSVAGSDPSPLPSDADPLYPPGHPLRAEPQVQAALTDPGISVQKRPRGRPRKGQNVAKQAKQAAAVPVSSPLRLYRHSRGRLPARYQDSVGLTQLDRAVEAATAADAEHQGGRQGGRSVEEKEGGDSASCHIRLSVLPLPPPAAESSSTAQSETPADMATPASCDVTAADDVRVDGDVTAVDDVNVTAVDDVNVTAVDDVNITATDDGRDSGDVTGAEKHPTASAKERTLVVQVHREAHPAAGSAPGALREGWVVRRGRVQRTRLRRFQCEVCAKRFLHDGRLQFHRALHRGVRFECVQCSSRFKQLSELTTHQMETSHSGQGFVEGVDDEPYVISERHACSECVRTFRTATTLAVHQREQHCSAEKTHVCPDCQKRFALSSSLHAHMKNHQESEPRPKYPCGLCERVFNSRPALSYHCDSKHNDGRLFICNLCSKGFRTQMLLARHAAVHSTERKYKCSHCPATFKTSGNLTNHQVLHTGEKRFACAQCPERFAHRTSLESHIRWHNGERQFSCTLCSRRFSTRSNLKEHLRVHTGEKPYSCSSCSRLFSSSSQLSLHTQRHSGGSVAPFCCSSCNGKEFKSRRLWLAHRQLTHPGEPPPYTCDECGKHIASQGLLARHVRTHQKQRMSEAGHDVVAEDGLDIKPLVREPPSGTSIPTPSDPKTGSQVIYVTYANPGDPSTVQFVTGVPSEGGGAVQLSADSEVLLQTAAAGVVELAANRGLLTSEGVCTLELTADDGRRVQITLRDDKGEMDPPGPSGTGAQEVGPGGDSMLPLATPPHPQATTVFAESQPLVDHTEPPRAAGGATVLVTGGDGRQFRLVAPAGTDPVQFATEYVNSLTTAG